MSDDASAVVAQALNDGKYDLPLFLNYLRSFTVSGGQPERGILLGILMQSLARFPTSDFTACMCLVPGHVQNESSVEGQLNAIYELENLLSCGRFTAFWEQWHSVKEHLPQPFHFEGHVRASIVETVSLTVERFSVERLAGYLAVPVEKVKETVEAIKEYEGTQFNVVSCDNKEIVFTRNPYNHPESHLRHDNIKFSDIVSIIKQ